MLTRRTLIESSAAMTALLTVGCRRQKTGSAMYGMIAKITTVEEKRDAFIAVLFDGTRDMPGCLNYIISKDTGDPDVVWVTEFWDNKAAHQASLQLPSVQAAIGKGRPLMSAMEQVAVIEPVAGQDM